jgi:DNA-binding GntR family transcriptional regulator
MNRKTLKANINSTKFERLKWDPNLRERLTTPDHLANALRAAIFDGQFLDNEELNQVELAAFFGVSRVPVREALRQLQAEGLVQSIAHHRTIVSAMTPAQIIESFEMRAVLEGHLLRKAGKHITSTDVEKLRKTCKECARIKSYGSDWVLKNWEFHNVIYDRSESPIIVDVVKDIQLKIERYARRTGTKERLRQAADEHFEILAAIERKDFVKAGALLESHIVHAGEMLLQRQSGLETVPAASAAKPTPVKVTRGGGKTARKVSSKLRRLADAASYRE